MTGIPLTGYSDVAGLWPFRALGNFEFNFVTLFERFEPLSLNGGVVDKHIFAALNLDKSKSLLIVEPFDSSYHCDLLKMKYLESNMTYLSAYYALIPNKQQKINVVFSFLETRFFQKQVL
jgi:hypothetical protein